MPREYTIKMNKINVKIKKVRDSAVIPEYKTVDSAGCDLVAAMDEPITLGPLERTMFPIGIAISIEEPGIAAFVFPRSGNAVKFGLTLPNCVGVIDRDYRGEISVPLVNLSNKEYTVNPGDRIAQLVFMEVKNASFFPAESLDQTERGEMGFGSTGK